MVHIKKKIFKKKQALGIKGNLSLERLPKANVL